MQQTIKLQTFDKFIDWFNAINSNAELTDQIITNIGDLINLQTTNKTNIVSAVNEVNTNTNNNTTKIGNLNSLQTTTKSSLVNAINEVNTNTISNTSNIGNLVNLQTTNKSNIVSAVNEVNTNVNNIGIKKVSSVPTSATSTGNIGDIAFDTNYLYICVASNTWKRVALTSW